MFKTNILYKIYHLSTHHLSSHEAAGHNHGTSFVVSCFPVEDAILAIRSRRHLSSCTLFSYSCRCWLSVAKDAVLKQAITSDHYSYCLFLKEIHKENFSLRNQRPKFRSINLKMQGSCQSFCTGLPLNRFCILTFSLSWGFLFVFNLGKVFLMFCCLREYDSNTYFRCMS